MRTDAETSRSSRSRSCWPADAARAAAAETVKERRGEVLHGAVVQARRDDPALGARGLDGTLEQQLPLPLVAAHPCREVPDQRDEQEHEEQQAGQGHAGEAAPQLRRTARDLVVGLVDLEEHGAAARRPDRPVHLDQLALRGRVEPVLVAVEVGDLGDGARIGQRLLLLGVEREVAPHQSGLVGVEHRSAGGPELHVGHVVAEHPVVDELVEGRHRGGVAGEQPVGEGRLHHGLGQEVGTLGGVVDRLALGQPSCREGAADGDDGEHDQDPRHQLEQDPSQGERCLAVVVRRRLGDGDPGAWRGLVGGLSRRIRAHPTPGRRCSPSRLSGRPDPSPLGPRPLSSPGSAPGPRSSPGSASRPWCCSAAWLAAS